MPDDLERADLTAAGDPVLAEWLGQNVHRYFFYVALVFNVILTWDAIVALDFGGHIGIDRRAVLRERQGLGLCNITKCCDNNVLICCGQPENDVALDL